MPTAHAAFTIVILPTAPVNAQIETQKCIFQYLHNDICCSGIYFIKTNEIFLLF